MIDLEDETEVKGLQSNLRATFDTPVGKEIMRFMEQICGWYDFNASEPNQILIAHGKRQVLATIKTLLKLKPDQVVALMRQREI